MELIGEENKALELTDLSYSLLVRCFRGLTPSEIVSAGQTCSLLLAASQDNAELWGGIYAAKWDVPPREPSSEDGQLCRRYMARERLLEAIPMLPSMCASVQIENLRHICVGIRRILFTGHRISKACETLATAGVGDSLLQACRAVGDLILDARQWNALQELLASSGLVTTVEGWLYLSTESDPCSLAELTDTADLLHKALNILSEVSEGTPMQSLRVAISAMLAAIQYAIWASTGAEGGRTKMCSISQEGVYNLMPAGGRKPFLRRRQPRTGREEVSVLGGLWRGVRFANGQHESPEVTMSLMLTVSADKKTVSAVGQDSVGSFKMEGALRHEPNQDFGGLTFGDIHFEMSYIEYGGIPAALVHARSVRPRKLMLHGQISPVAISGCFIAPGAGCTGGSANFSGTFALWPRTRK